MAQRGQPCQQSGLETNDISGREWRTESGAIGKVELCLIDANWGQHTNVVTQFCRRSSFANILRPSHGIGIAASRKPLNDPETRPKAGERRGLHWRIVRGKDSMRRVHFDTNFWKSFVFNRWAVPIGDSGSLTLFTGNAAAHRMLLEQATAEYCVRTEGRGRVIDQWELRVGRDNHYLDCLVGCAVAASIQGVSTGEQADVSSRRRPRIKLSDVYAKNEQSKQPQPADDGARCPFCGERQSRVVYVRHKSGWKTMRKRRCVACGETFLTYERTQPGGFNQAPKP